MSDKYAGVVVTFEKDLSDEGIERVKQALELMRGVVSVKPVVSGVEQLIAEERVRREIGQKLLAVVWPDRG